MTALKKRMERQIPLSPNARTDDPKADEARDVGLHEVTPNPTVGGGLMALFSPLYPRGPVNVGAYLHTLPAEGTVSFMPG